MSSYITTDLEKIVDYITFIQHVLVDDKEKSRVKYGVIVVEDAVINDTL